MIKLPREVSRIMKTLESAGHEVYAVGACVRDSLLGGDPLDFDLATDATLDEMKELFPKAVCLIFGQPNSKVKSRNYMMKKFEANHDPIYIEDLAISGQDLIDEGIVRGDDEKRKVDPLVSQGKSVCRKSEK